MVKKINARCSSGPLDFDLPFTPLKKNGTRNKSLKPT